MLIDDNPRRRGNRRPAKGRPIKCLLAMGFLDQFGRIRALRSMTIGYPIMAYNF